MHALLPDCVFALLWTLLLLTLPAFLVDGDGLTVDDESIRMFVTSPPVVDYFSDLIIFLRQQSFGLDRLVTEVSK